MESVYTHAADYGTNNNRLSLNNPYVDFFCILLLSPFLKYNRIHFAHTKYKIVL